MRATGGQGGAAAIQTMLPSVHLTPSPAGHTTMASTRPVLVYALLDFSLAGFSEFKRQTIERVFFSVLRHAGDKGHGRWRPRGRNRGLVPAEVLPCGRTGVLWLIETKLQRV